MKKNEKDPTTGWAWDPEMQCFMQPSLCFDDRWKVADIPWEKAQDPAYRYDPARHPLYEDALQQQSVQLEAKKRAEDRSEAIRRTFEYLRWKNAESAQNELEEYNNTYGLTAANAGYLYLDGDLIRELEEPVAPVRPQTRRTEPNRWYNNPSVRNYDIESRVGEIEQQQQNPTLSGYFDGTTFTIRQDDGRTVYQESYPGYSGRSDANRHFDYSPERQRMVDQGPIPEGTYWINPQKIMKLKDTSLWDKAKGLARKGTFPGGSESWGVGKVEIYPQQIEVGGVKRGNFTIHGGDLAGSKGCIDLLDREKNFFDFLEKHRASQDSIPIFVQYPPTDAE